MNKPSGKLTTTTLNLEGRIWIDSEGGSEGEREMEMVKATYGEPIIQERKGAEIHY